MKHYFENFTYFLADIVIAIPMLSYTYRKESRGFLLWTIIIPALGVVVSSFTGEWHWFARSGSVMVAISILVSISTLLHERKADQLDELSGEIGKRENTSYSIVRDGEEEELTPEMAKELAEERRDVSTSHYLVGIAGAIIGTLIWGFGDLIG